MLGLVCCVLISLLFVGLLYLWHGLPRDHPHTVKRRLASTAVVCLLAWLPACLLARSICSKQGSLRFQKQSVDIAPGLGQQASNRYICLTSLGIRKEGFWAALTIPLCLTCTLFAGPLLLLAFDIGDLPAHRQLFFTHRHWLVVFRDLVAAPVAEEWAFRACMIPLLSMERWSPGWVTAVTPLFFGAAHLHHVHELVKYQGYPLRQALVQAGFQLTYTTVFGWYASWLFLRTGHVVAPIGVHAFCNAMGFPQFGRMARHRHRSIFMVVLVGGVLLFAYCLGPLTHSSLYHWSTDYWQRPCAL